MPAKIDSQKNSQNSIFKDGHLIHFFLLRARTSAAYQRGHDSIISLGRPISFSVVDLLPRVH
jgi:hypothetical protein